MDYLNDVCTSFLGLESGSCVASCIACVGYYEKKAKNMTKDIKFKTYIKICLSQNMNVW